jgi:hypothetical protein
MKMKVKVIKYHPGFVEMDEVSEILEFECDNSEWIYGKGTDAKTYIMENIWFLEDKIGKVEFRHNTLTQTMVKYEDKPYAWINLLEI